MRMIVTDVRAIAGTGTPSASLMEKCLFFPVENSCRILTFIP